MPCAPLIAPPDTGPSPTGCARRATAMAAASASAAASSSAGPGTEKPAPGALLEAALRQCEHLTADPLQGSAALDVASDAAAALLRLAAQPAGHAAELERAVR